MSDDEAINYLKEAIELYEDGCYISTGDDFKAIRIILNLIDKKQKEIEELKKDNEHQWKERCRLTFKLDIGEE